MRQRLSSCCRPAAKPVRKVLLVTCVVVPPNMWPDVPVSGSLSAKPQNLVRPILLQNIANQVAYTSYLVFRRIISHWITITGGFDVSINHSRRVQEAE